MEAIKIATPRERLFVVVLSILVGLLLTVGFLPAAASLFNWLWKLFGPNNSEARDLGRIYTFPALAWLFYLSIPREKRALGDRVPWEHCLRISILPFLIAAGFGLITHPLLLLDPQRFYWFIFCVPVGEEFLFRGWVYGILERIWPRTFLTATNPFPVALWGSSIAFSLWHLQNIGEHQIAFVCFQCAYTLLTGLWLGYLRWKTKNPLFGCVAHTVINLLGAASWQYLE